MIKCECELEDFFEAGIAPVCGEFEATSTEDCEDCCVHCRHREYCHLNG